MILRKKRQRLPLTGSHVTDLCWCLNVFSSQSNTLHDGRSCFTWCCCCFLSSGQSLISDLIFSTRVFWCFRGAVSGLKSVVDISSLCPRPCSWLTSGSVRSKWTSQEWLISWTFTSVCLDHTHPLLLLTLQKPQFYLTIIQLLQTTLDILLHKIWNI